MRIELRVGLLATTALISLSGAVAAAPNIVNNGDFEGGLTGWTCIADESCTSGAGGNPGAAFSGYDDSGSSSVYQTLSTTPGIYLVTYDFKDEANSGSALAMQFGANAPAGVTLTNSYQTSTQVVATNTANTDVAFIYSTFCCTSIVRIDNVSVVLVDDGLGNNIGAAAQTVAVQASRDLLDRLQDRFNHAGSPIQSASVRETVVAAAGSGTYVNAGGKYRAFMNVFGSHGEWGSNATEADRRGVSLGAEMAATQGLDVGAAFAFSRTDFDTKTGVTINIGDTYEYLGALYAHWTPSSMPLYVNVLGGYGSSSNDLSRANTLGSAAASDVSADQWFGSAEIGWDWQRSGMMLTPFVRFDIARVEQDGYTESASGLFVPAVVAGRDFDAMRSILGLRAEWDISSIGRYGAKVGAKAGWAHEFEQDRLVTFAQTVAPTVVLAGTATGAQPEEDTAVVGANFEVAIGGDTSIYAGYNGNFGGNQAINAGEAGVRVTW